MDIDCSTDSKICLQILDIWAHIKTTIEQFATDHELTTPQIIMLYQLYHTDHILMGTLAKHLRCDASNVTGMVDRLQAAGLIKRREMPEDRRAKQLSITPDGKRLIDDLVPLLPQRLGFGELSHEETASLRRLLSKLTAGS